MQHPLTRRALGSLSSCALVLTLAARVAAAPVSGTLDPTFGAGGKVSLPIAADPKHDEVFAVALDPDGRLVVGGYAAVANQQWAVARLLEDGSPDPGFGDGAGSVVVALAAPAHVRALAVQDDGKIVAAGSTRQGADDDFALARFLADGDRDPGFGVGGTLVTSFSTIDDLARAVAVQPDGKIVAAGFVRAGANRDFALARYLSDGTPDPAFDGDGRHTLSFGAGDEEAYAVAVQDDGRILVAGYATEGTQHDMLVARLTPAGALDPSFNGTGFARIAFDASDDSAAALALQPDGKILVAGHARVGSVVAFAVARLAADGTLDPTFGAGGKVATPIGTTAEGRALVLHPRGRLTVAGRARVDGKVSFAAAQYRADGTLDPTFGTGGIVTVPLGSRTDEGYGIVRQDDGKLVLAGTTQTGSNKNFGLVRLLASDCGDGVLDAPAEECDDAHQGGATCCSLECALVAAGGECRPARGACDAAESCDGASFACPDDEFLPAATPCRSVQGACDVAEACTGDAAACPADERVPAGVPCRAGSDACDPGESCDGVGAACPADTVAQAGTPCRASAGGCDAAESCDGATGACPADLPAAAGTVCRAPATPCDAAEQCDGASFACPADALAPAGTVCRPVDGACDVADSCDGLSESCPEDASLPDGDGDGTCDLVDVCPEASDPAQADGDSDGLGDACDPCTNGLALAKPVVRLANLDTPPGDDTVRIKGRLVFDPTRPPIDPRANGMRVILEGASGDVLFDVAIPPGTLVGPGPGWRTSPSGASYLFKSPTAVGGLARRIRVKLPPTRPRQVEVQIDGHGQDFSHVAAAAPLRVTLVVDPPGAVAGHCGEATFPGPAPEPACSLASGQLLCR
jgi:uncharacterized delta-60 repeat protein